MSDSKTAYFVNLFWGEEGKGFGCRVGVLGFMV